MRIAQVAPRSLLHNQTAAVIKAYLLFSGFRRVVINVPVPWYLCA
jgi:hypothetical protein